MLTLHYENERACIDGAGSVDYYENRGHAMVMTEAPSQTIMQMVRAVIPFVSTSLNDAFARVQRLKMEVRDIAAARENAEKMESAARERQSELLAQLQHAEEALQKEQSC